MKFLVAGLFIIFSLGQLDRWSLVGNEVVFHFNDLAVLIVVIFGLRQISGPIAKALFIFLAAIILSLIFNLGNYSVKQLLVASLYPFRFFIYAGLYFVFKNLSAENKKFTRRWLFLGILIIAITGLLQYIFLPNVAFLSAFDWDDHYYRLIGTFLDPGFTGIILVLGIIMTYPRTIMALFYLAMALTYSRASYLSYLISFAAISFYKKSLKIFLIAAVVLALTIPALPKSTGEGTKLSRENSFWARINNWQRSLIVWRESPIFGVGFNTYRTVVITEPQSHSGGADSSLLLVLATTGIVGILAYLNLLKSMWITGKNNLIFKAGFLAVLAHSFFNNTLFYPWVMEWLWIMLAL